MSLSRWLLALTLPLAPLACEEEPAEKKEAPVSGEATPAPCSPDQGTALIEDCGAPAANAEETTDGLGLADICSYELRDSGEACFICQPRDLPTTKCVTVASGFDPAGMCHHDLDRLTCDVGAAKDFVFEFDERTPLEDLYDKIELLAFAAKAVAYDRLADKPDMRAAIFALLDEFVKSKQAFFMGGDVQPFIVKAQELAKVLKPDVSETELTAVQTGIQAAAKSFSAKVKASADGGVSYKDALAIVTDILAAMPESLTKDALSGIDLAPIDAALKGGGGAEILTDLLASVGGGKSLTELLSEITGAGADGISAD